MRDEVWLALRMADGDVEVLGIFRDKLRAFSACRERNDVVRPVPLDVELPDGEWDAVYPAAVDR